MEKFLQKCKRCLAVLLAALMVYGGVKNAMLAMAAADISINGQSAGEAVSADEQTTGEAVSADEQSTGEAVSADGKTTAESIVAEERVTVSGGDAALEGSTAPGVNADSEAILTEGAVNPATNAGNEIIPGMGNSGAGAGEIIFETYTLDVEFPDNDELFAGYAEQLFYGGADPGISLFGNVGGDRLTGEDEKKVYNALKAAIQDIAAGNRTSAENISVEGLSDSVVQNLDAIVENVMACLLMDCPYDLYWYDKTVGVGCSGFGAIDGITLNFSFAVAQGYQGADAYSVDSSRVNSAKAAAAKARDIVDKYAGKSDYEKLAAYRQEICALVAYNYSAASDDVAYGDPWQLIWVFDSDSGTNVVCEGYSKAFQYLCDLSSFSSGIVCYTVTGMMGGGTGAGPHMWNIVTIGGENYIVDVTNCDTGAVGAPDKLFLAGAAGSVAGGYTVALGGQSITYVYDPDQEGLLGSVLPLADKNYQPKVTPPVTVTAPTGVHVTFGDKADNDALSANGNVTTVGSATAVIDGKTVTVEGSFQWTESVMTNGYGEAGVKKLAAVFKPEDTNTYESAYSVDVSVTVDRRPVTVTVAADAGTKVYGQNDPELTYTAAGTVTTCPLSGKLQRAAGENVGSYAITLGTLTDENNPNYTIAFGAPAPEFTITQAQCTIIAADSQTVTQGVGQIVEPEFKGVKGEQVAGTITYSYGDLTNGTYDQLTGTLKALALNTTGEITYSFTPASANYAGSVTGKISFTVKDIEFVTRTGPVALGNGVTLKAAPVYGDTWAAIVTVTGITAQAGSAKDSNAGHFTLDVTGMPDAGNNIPFTVLYNGSLNGKEYKDVTVCGGTVNVARRSITVTAGTYQVSKVYDGTTDSGTASGQLAVSGILTKDTGVSVTVSPVAYNSPNAGGQTQMTLPLTLSGTGAENYVLAEAGVAVPCAITPKTITPAVEITGTYSYTGSAIIPVVVVKNGSQVMAAADYELTFSNNVNAGTAKVFVRPKGNSNYTWSTIEKEFVIGRADYSGEQAVSVTVRYGTTGALELADLLPEGFKLGTVTVTDSDGILDGMPALSENRLSFRLVDDKTKIGKTAVITVPVTETLNYNGFELTITVIMSDKRTQTGFAFQEAAVDRVYGDADFTAAIVNAAPGSSLTFTSSDPTVATVDNSGKIHILRAGSAVITVNAAETEDYLAASAVCALTVAPKDLTWDVSGLTAVDREGTIQNRTASLYGELKVSGILESDRADAVYNCPAELLTGIYMDVSAGTQNVVLAWKDTGNRAVLQGTKAENYTMPSVLPAIIGRINAVSTGTAPIPESSEAMKFSITLENGISQVPEAFKNLEHLNTPVKLEAQMVQKVQTVVTVQNQTINIPRENIAVYDVNLMVSVNGGEWQPAEKSNFPANGLTVTLPYPAGTGRDSHDFTVCHLFTEDMNGHLAGETEYPEVTKTAEGISFKVYGLSPVSVAWRPAGTPDNIRDGEDLEETVEETVVNTPAAASTVKSPRTGQEPEKAAANVLIPARRKNPGMVWPFMAVLLFVGLKAYMWQRRCGHRFRLVELVKKFF